MLIQLLRTYLRRYRPWLILILIFQSIQAMATLFLPTLNASIIDNGALKGDTDYIWKFGAIMLGVTFVQVVFAIAATFYGSRSAMGVGRDVRRDLFHTVIGYSAREVGQFGSSSLITRITNDVTQVQVFTLMSLTLFVTAPIMITGGVIMAVREDGPLSMILLVAVPLLLLSVGQVAIRMHPQFTKMQERIDRVNQILREQITGIRVVRAFVREPDEAVRFGHANADLTETSLKTGRMMAVMFPAVLLTINLSSVAAVYFGADRINSGQMQVGALVAFLSYLIQILMAVMMGTFVLMMGPRASVCAGRIQEVLQTSSSVVAPDDGVTELPERDLTRGASRRVRVPRRRATRAARHQLPRRRGSDARHHRQHRLGQDRPAEHHRPAVRRDLGRGAHRRRQRARARPPADRTPHRIRPSAALPVLGHGGQQRAVRQPGRNRRPRCGRRWRWHRHATSWRPSPISWSRRSPRAAPTCPEASASVSPSRGALAHKPAIYLFDDSFSALDLATDARLRAALAPVTRDAVTVVVAQRVSTIVRADQILVLEEGRGRRSRHPP